MKWEIIMSQRNRTMMLPHIKNPEQLQFPEIQDELQQQIADRAHKWCQKIVKYIDERTKK
jgi:hypothetical protein